MTVRRRLKISIGKQRVSSPKFASERSYVADIQGQMKDMEDTLLDILKQFEEASEEIMLSALEPTFKKARDVYCPIDTGDLRRSGYLEVASFRGKPRVEIGFGKGGNPFYTVWVHEMLNMTHEPPTRAKFLQAAVLEDLSEIYQRLGAEYKAFMGT